MPFRCGDWGGWVIASVLSNLKKLALVRGGEFTGDLRWKTNASLASISIDADRSYSSTHLLRQPMLQRIADKLGAAVGSGFAKQPTDVFLHITDAGF